MLLLQVGLHGWVPGYDARRLLLCVAAVGSHSSLTPLLATTQRAPCLWLVRLLLLLLLALLRAAVACRAGLHDKCGALDATCPQLITSTITLPYPQPIIPCRLHCCCR